MKKIFIITLLLFSFYTNTYFAQTNTYSLNWSTYFGGSYHEYPKTVLKDANGNKYIYGHSSSSDLTTVQQSGAFFQGSYAGGNLDLYLSKFDKNDSLLYNTYIGGSMDDYAGGMVMDSVGNIYLCGYTNSTDFPLINNGVTGSYYKSTIGSGGSFSIGNDVFLIKLDSNLQMVHSTYFGGGETDLLPQIFLTKSGNIILSGVTASTDFPIVNTAQEYSQSFNGGGTRDIFIAKFNTDFKMTFSTYYGGGNEDLINGIAEIGNNYVIVGSTYSSDLPMSNVLNLITDTTFGGNTDAFIAMFNNSNQLVYSSYEGDSGSDEYKGVVDNNGKITFYGNTNSANFPTTINASYNFNNTISPTAKVGFISEKDTNFLTTWTSFIADDVLKINKFNNSLYVNAVTFSPSLSYINFPTNVNYVNPTSAGVQDIVIMQFDSVKTVEWGTFFGGSNSDSFGDSFVDSTEYIVIGSTLSLDMDTATPSVSAYYQNHLFNNNPSFFDAFYSSFSKKSITTVTENTKNGLISVYPNPTKGIITLRLQTASVFLLYDIMGRKIITGRLQKGANKINLFNKPKGLYILEITNPFTQERITYRIAKE